MDDLILSQHLEDIARSVATLALWQQRMTPPARFGEAERLRRELDIVIDRMERVGGFDYRAEAADG
jgi:hypothetical protein